MILKRIQAALEAFKSNWPILKRAFRDTPISVLIVALFRNSQFILFGNASQSHRLEVCSTCEYQNENFCLLCGCHIPAKVLVKENACPAGRWKE